MPVFAFDDDYVSLSPIVTPSPEDKTTLEASTTINNNKNNNNSNTIESFVPHANGKDLTTISEKTETPSSRISSMESSHLPSPAPEIMRSISPTIPSESHKTSSIIARSSPEVQILDITDLDDPGVRVVSSFSFKDVDDEFNIVIYGIKNFKSERLEYEYSYRCYRC